ncbi:MAG: STAS domain-containing protein [bacterium]
MKIEQESIGDLVILTLSGELDSRGNHLLNRTLHELADHRMYKVILDISMIRFVGNQTISILLSNLKEMRAGGGDIKILNAQKSVLQYLKQNRMIQLFHFFTTRSEAIRDFESSSFNAQPANSSPAEFPYQPITDKPVSETLSRENIKSHFETGEILYANSCILAALIRRLQDKGVLTAEEASELLEYEKGESDDSSPA